MSKKKIALIVGPTAIGKTAAAISVAKHVDAEIISADAIQVYRGLDIGSAKPNKDELKQVPHHLIDCVDTDSCGYSVAEFKKLAQNSIEDIHNRGKLPLVVGGTGLYINALVYPLDFTNVPPDEHLRESLLNDENASPGCLYKRLQEMDPERAFKLHPNDLKRIVRALEININGGKQYKEYGDDFENKENKDTEYDPIMLGLTMPRDMLYERINIRVDMMMEEGLQAEVQGLIKSGADLTRPAFSALGYKQLIAYLTNTDDNGEKMTLDDTVELIKRETRRFAKRQITWFKRDSRIKWFDRTDYSSVEELGFCMAEHIKKEIVK